MSLCIRHAMQYYDLPFYYNFSPVSLYPLEIHATSIYQQRFKYFPVLQVPDMHRRIFRPTDQVSTVLEQATTAELATSLDTQVEQTNTFTMDTGSDRSLGD